MLIILSLYDTLFVYRLIICFRLNLNLMTLHIESTHVYTQNGVAVSLMGIAQVRQYVTACSAFNIFQVCQYFTIYRQYFFIKIWNNFHEYLIQHSLKSGGTKDHFRRVKVPGTSPY